MQQKGKKLFTKKRAFLLAIILFLALIYVYRQSQSGLEVEITYLQNKDLSESISAAGSIEPNQKATLSFPLGGKISYIGVKEGNFVNKSQVLASLDKNDLNATYQQSLSDLRLAEATLERVYDNVKGNEVAESFTAKETRTQAEVAKDKAFDAVKIARNALINADIVSPITGYVVSVSDSFYTGAFVGPTDTIEVVDPSSLYFVVEVNEVDIPNIHKAQKATITLDAYPNNEINSLVESIDIVSTTTSTGGTGYKVKLSLPKSENDYLVGMNGDAEFLIQEKKDIKSVPITAVTDINDKTYVWIVNKENTAEKIEVVTGISSISDIEIISGDIEGQPIILNPPANISDGMKVRIS